MSLHTDTQAPRPKALLVGLQLPQMTEADNIASLQELKRLVDTLGFEVVGQLTQKRGNARAALVVGEGKLRELAAWTGGPGFIAPSVIKKKTKAQEKFDLVDAEDDLDVEHFQDTRDFDESDDLDSEHDAAEAHAGFEDDSVESDSPTAGPPDGVQATVVVFDSELSPSQLRNLQSATGAEVLDRTGVIIEIFSRHARTRAAKLQVEIARLKYLAPRIRETGGASERQGGGVGGKGSGESSQELDRRHIRDRIKELRTELQTVQQESSIRRNRRSEENSVALVGYTNAGKSSLMRAMTGSEILVADKLFATLDTTVRPMHPPSLPRVLLSDTVGFIKKLPHDLVASFHSTLEEALHADLLLYVVDASDPTFRQQLEVTKQVLGEIGATEHPSLMILNKRDRLSSAESAALKAEYPEAIQLSTRDKDDLAALRETLLQFFEKDMTEADLMVPYAVQGAIGEIRRQMRVIGESYTEGGVTLKVRARQEDLARVRGRFKI
jgi:GTP-binding protein HflX